MRSEGKPARETSRLVLARTGRTDRGCRCPRLLGRRTPLAAHQSRLPACYTLVKSFRLSCPSLPDVLSVTTCRDQSAEAKIKGNTPLRRKGERTGISKSLAAATPGVQAQVIAVCVIASVILFFFPFFFLDMSLMIFFLLVVSNPLWKKKQEREWQGDNIVQMAFHTSIDCNRINDTERQGSFIYFAS